MPKPVKNCIELLITATKWLPVLVTLLIYTWGYYAYTFQLVLYTMENLVQQISCFVILNLLFVLSFWSYIQTIISPQGKIPSKFYLSKEASEDLAKAPSEQARDEMLAYVVKTNDLPVSCRTYSGGVRFCEKCILIKPDRCHHCSICGVCILRMDHHCPWINNCVSFTNYKFFVLFLGYTFALCIFVGGTTLPYTLNFWNYPENVYKPNNSTSTPETPQNSANDAIVVPFSVRFHILFLCFVSSMLSFGVMFLYCYHIHLLLRNQSTLESFRAPLMAHGPDKNAFNLGKRNNALQLFGRSKLLWFVPVFTTEGSGITYEQRPNIGLGDEEARQELLNHRTNNNASRQNIANTDTEL